MPPRPELRPQGYPAPYMLWDVALQGAPPAPQPGYYWQPMNRRYQYLHALLPEAIPAGAVGHYRERLIFNGDGPIPNVGNNPIQPAVHPGPEEELED